MANILGLTHFHRGNNDRHFPCRAPFLLESNRQNVKVTNIQAVKILSDCVNTAGELINTVRRSHSDGVCVVRLKITSEQCSENPNECNSEEVVLKLTQSPQALDCVITAVWH